MKLKFAFFPNRLHRNRTITFLALFPLLLSSNLTYSESGANTVSALSFIGGKTYVPLNIGEVRYSELAWQQAHNTIVDTSHFNVSFQTESAVGQVLTQAGDGTVISFGPRIQASIFNNLHIGAAFRFSYLDKHIYRLNNGTTVKNYGGPRQFQYYGEVLYQIEKDISFGYRWQHMSNGMQVLPEAMKYQHNPVINTHNFAVQWAF